MKSSRHTECAVRSGIINTINFFFRIAALKKNRRTAHGVCLLLSNAELAEDSIENVFRIDGADHSAELI